MARQFLKERRKVLLLAVGVSLLAATSMLFLNEGNKPAEGNQTLLTQTTEPALKPVYSQRTEYRNPLLFNASGQCTAMLGGGLLVTDVPLRAEMKEESEVLIYAAKGLIAERFLRTEAVDCSRTSCGASGRALWTVARESVHLDEPCRIEYRLSFSE